MAKRKLSLEELAKEIYNECAKDGEAVTEAEALEMAKMELGSKAIKNYVQSTPEKKNRKPRERKVDDEKLELITEVQELLEVLGAENINIHNEVKIHFTFNKSSYTFTLTKHRLKK